jgi:ABC-type multidrug transport system permease subunit
MTRYTNLGCDSLVVIPCASIDNIAFAVKVVSYGDQAIHIKRPLQLLRYCRDFEGKYLQRTRRFGVRITLGWLNIRETHGRYTRCIIAQTTYNSISKI